MKKKIIILISGIIGIILLIVGITYAHYYIKEEKNDINGTALSANLSVNVSLSVDAGDLIPMKDIYLSNALVASSPCVDNNGYATCRLYTVTVTNNGSTSVPVESNIVFHKIGSLDNLKWQEISSLTTIGEISGASSGAQATLASSETTKWRSGDNIASGETKTYYIAVWISSISGDQSDQDDGTYTAEISFYVNHTGFTSLASVLADTILGDNSLPLLSGTEQGSIQNGDYYTVIHHPQTEQMPEGYSYRYTGASPDNYITFNDELWRIIGVEQVELSNGKYEYLTKIIRNASIGTYSWDNKNSSTGAESSYGKNDWATSRLMQTLNPGYETKDEDKDNTYEGNSLYWNSQDGRCYYSSGNGETTCNLSGYGLKSASRNYIENVNWKLGGFTSAGRTYILYNAQNGNTTYTGRSTNANGKVGLMYAYDFGYASGKTCFDGTNVSSYSSSCRNYNWLYYGFSSNEWTMSIYSSYGYYVWYKYSGGYLSYTYPYTNYAIRPVVYLKATTKLVGGRGKSTDPYQIEI